MPPKRKPRKQLGSGTEDRITQWANSQLLPFSAGSHFQTTQEWTDAGIYQPTNKTRRIEELVTQLRECKQLCSLYI